MDVDWKKGEVKLNIHEGERLFEGLLVGRHIDEAYWITPRICGVCPIAHNLASVHACEDGYGIKTNPTTNLLRDLMNCGQMIQSHILHLAFLSLPDYLGIDRATELAKKKPKVFKMVLDLKEVSDDIAHIVAGRNVHPTTTTIGGFHKVPSKKELSGLLKKIKKTRKAAGTIMKISTGIKYPELKADVELVAQDKKNILSTKDKKVSAKDYKKVITEEIRTYSTAKFGSYKKREMMVGALARLYFLKKEVKKLVPREVEGIDFNNPFYNNMAQGIETYLYHVEAEKLIEKLLQKKIDSATMKHKKTHGSRRGGAHEGIGFIEAPRGGLYHEYHFDKDGIITYANIITPTVQNLTSIENCANLLVKQHENKSQKEKEHLLEMLVRAYDPCITCSVH